MCLVSLNDLCQGLQAAGNCKYFVSLGCIFGWFSLIVVSKNYQLIWQTFWPQIHRVHKLEVSPSIFGYFINVLFLLNSHYTSASPVGEYLELSYLSTTKLLNPEISVYLAFDFHFYKWVFLSLIETILCTCALSPIFFHLLENVVSA